MAARTALKYFCIMACFPSSSELDIHSFQCSTQGISECVKTQQPLLLCVLLSSLLRWYSQQNIDNEQTHIRLLAIYCSSSQVQNLQGLFSLFSSITFSSDSTTLNKMPSVMNSCYCYQYSAVPEKASSPWGNASNCTTFPKLPSSIVFHSLLVCDPNLTLSDTLTPTLFASQSLHSLLLSSSWLHLAGATIRGNSLNGKSQWTVAARHQPRGGFFHWNHKQYCISYTIACREGGRKGWWKTLNVCVWGLGIYSAVNEPGWSLQTW